MESTFHGPQLGKCPVQELLDVTRGLLEEWERAVGGGGGGGELKLDADQDETREKFRIVKVVEP